MIIGKLVTALNEILSDGSAGIQIQNVINENQLYPYCILSDWQNPINNIKGSGISPIRTLEFVLIIVNQTKEYESSERINNKIIELLNNSEDELNSKISGIKFTLLQAYDNGGSYIVTSKSSEVNISINFRCIYCE